MRADELIALLKLAPHPEGGHYREIFRADARVQPTDGRPARSALTSIDFLLQAGEFSAWHRVRSDEVWHLLEGGPLRLWCLPPTLDRIVSVDLAAASATATPRHIVPADWWQAAEPLAGFAYVGATVGPGFEFADFAFARDDAQAMAAIEHLQPSLARLAGASRP
jgi:uncharacterized protein